jgi:vanadium chloroperoxidase
MTDPILYWNDVAIEANRVDHTEGKEQPGPTLSSRALAIVHLAMYDAYAGARNNPPSLKPYLTGMLPPLPPAGTDPAAAIAAAAQSTLSALFPRQKAFFEAKHAAAGLTGATQALVNSHDYGLAVAQAMLKDRKGDPDAGDNGYAPLMTHGGHRPDPDNPRQGYHAPFYGARSRCFAVTARHALDAPPEAVDSNAQYNAALKEVRAKGIASELMGTLPNHLVNSRRTPEETLIGIFWAYDGASGLGTPPRLYNQIVRLVAAKQAATTDQNARLFALVNVAMADAGILAWEQKYRYNYWRPAVGIREHDNSMGPVASPGHHLNNDFDLGWLPLGAPASNSSAKNFTPPFPAYPSGHATFGAAAFHITRRFFGVPAGNRSNDTLFEGAAFVSDELNGVNADNKGTVRPRHLRNFPGGLWEMIVENGRSRVFLGVHWVFDAFAVNHHNDPDFNQNIGGVPLGVNIAEDIFASGMKRSTV